MESKNIIAMTRTEGTLSGLKVGRRRKPARDGICGPYAPDALSGEDRDKHLREAVKESLKGCGDDPGGYEIDPGNE